MTKEDLEATKLALKNFHAKFITWPREKQIAYLESLCPPYYQDKVKP